MHIIIIKNSRISGIQLKLYSLKIKTFIVWLQIVQTEVAGAAMNIEPNPLLFDQKVEWMTPLINRVRPSGRDSRDLLIAFMLYVLVEFFHLCKSNFRHYFFLLVEAVLQPAETSAESLCAKYQKARWQPHQVEKEAALKLAENACIFSNLLEIYIDNIFKPYVVWPRYCLFFTRDYDCSLFHFIFSPFPNQSRFLEEMRDIFQLSNIKWLSGGLGTVLIRTVDLEVLSMCASHFTLMLLCHLHCSKNINNLQHVYQVTKLGPEQTVLLETIDYPKWLGAFVHNVHLGESCVVGELIADEEV